jgi:hypothetical protein
VVCVASRQAAGALRIVALFGRLAREVIEAKRLLRVIRSLPNVLHRAVQAFPRLPNEAVERLAVLALDALLLLGVNVHGHVRVGVADLAHHPEHVKAVGEQAIET